MSIEAMKEALEAFEHIQGMSWSIVTTATCKRNISNLRQAIEQAEKKNDAELTVHQKELFKAQQEMFKNRNKW